jgi:diguanylate cyclase (GGDEF)-like protein
VFIFFFSNTRKCYRAKIRDRHAVVCLQSDGKETRVALTITPLLSDAALNSPTTALEQYPIKMIGPAQGLPSSQVHDLIQDREGLFWFVGPSGLGCYDAARVRSFNQKNGLSTQGLRSLLRLPDDRILIGTDVGVDVLETDGQIRSLTDANTWSHGFVDCMVVHPDGFVFCGASHGVVRWSERAGFQSIKDPLLVGGSVLAMVVDKTGRIWAGGRNCGLLYFEANAWHQPSNDAWAQVGAVQTLALSPDGHVLVGGDRGLVELSLEGQILRTLSSPDQLISVHAICSVQDELWLGVNGLLCKYSLLPDSWQVDAVVLRKTRVNALVCDQFGNIWAATDNFGIARISMLRHCFTRPALADLSAVFSIQAATLNPHPATFNLENLRGKKQPIERSFYVGGNNSSYQLGLRHPMQSRTIKALTDSTVWDLIEDSSGQLWAACQSGLVRLTAGEAIKVGTHHPVFASANRVLIERQGHIWVGTVRGLGVVKQAADGLEFREVLNADQCSLGYVYTFFEDQSGVLWIGTLGNGLWYETPQGFVQVVSTGLIEKGNVYSISASQDGQLVILQDNRIVLARKAISVFVSRIFLETSYPVAGWAARSLPNGHLWVGTSSGLFEYELKTGKVLRQVTTWQDSSDLEFTTSRSLMVDRQNLICGLNSGLMIVKLDELEKIKVLPSVKLGAIRWVNGEAELVDDVITLKPGNWTLELEFFTAWFVDENSLRYRHRLLGFDAKWSEAKTLASLEYNSLPPGEYTLELQAYAPLVGWGAVSSLLTIVVLQPPLPAVLVKLRKWLNTSFLTSRHLREQNLALEQQVRSRMLQVAKINSDLQLANQRLRQMSFTDALTGIPNRRQFDELLAHEIQSAAQTGAWLSLALIDIDFFKGYNDAYGHPKGDRCLKRVASALNEELRETRDWVFRYGGEEFAILLPNTDQTVALLVVKRLRAAVERLGIPHEHSKVSKVVTISAGVISRQPNIETTPLELLNDADLSLYQAKNDGRNRVVSVK